jgi:hypothetical protein
VAYVKTKIPFTGNRHGYIALAACILRRPIYREELGKASPHLIKLIDEKIEELPWYWQDVIQERFGIIPGNNTCTVKRCARIVGDRLGLTTKTVLNYQKEAIKQLRNKETIKAINRAVEYITCVNPDCPTENPQPKINFNKNSFKVRTDEKGRKTHIQNYHRRCHICTNAKRKRKTIPYGTYNTRKSRKPRVIPKGKKWCTFCEEIHPATTEYFYRRKYSLDGLRHYCKIGDRVRNGYKGRAGGQKGNHNAAKLTEKEAQKILDLTYLGKKDTEIAELPEFTSRITRSGVRKIRLAETWKGLKRK